MVDVIDKYKIKELMLEGDRVFIKKSKYINWRVVYPYKINGKINWKNFLAGGSWFNLLWIAIVVGIILGCISEYVTMGKIANECMETLRSSNLDWIL